MGLLSGYAQQQADAARQQYADAAQQMHMHALYRRHRQSRAAGATDAARQLLGLGSGATPEEIRAAFACRAKEVHPDSGGAGGDIQQLKQARNLLLEEHRLPKNNDAATRSCQMCSGSGRVAMGFGNEPCTTCNGTGVAP